MPSPRITSSSASCSVSSNRSSTRGLSLPSSMTLCAGGEWQDVVCSECQAELPRLEHTAAAGRARGRQQSCGGKHTARPVIPPQTSAAPPDARKQTKHGTAAQNTGPHLEEAAAELLRKQLSPGAHQAALALYCGCQRLQADCRQGRRASGLARCPGRCRCWFGGWARQQLLAARRHSLCVGALYGRQWAGNGWHEAGAAPKAMKQQPGSNPVQAARRQRWRRRRWRRWRSTVYLWWLPRLLCASICAAVGRGSPARRRLQRSLLAAAQGAALPVLWLLPTFVVKKTSPPLQLAHERSRGSRISRAGKSSPRVTHGRLVCAASRSSPRGRDAASPQT